MEERVMMVKMGGEEGERRERESARESEPLGVWRSQLFLLSSSISADQMLSHVPHLQVPDPETGYNFTLNASSLPSPAGRDVQKGKIPVPDPWSAREAPSEGESEDSPDAVSLPVCPQDVLS